MALDSPTQSSNSMIRFADRWDAGEQLADAIAQKIVNNPNLHSPQWVVYGLPRGGVMVAAPIARSLKAPLDIIVAKKITRPENPELAIGAVTADGEAIWLPQPRLSPTPAYLYEMALHQARERACEQQQQLDSSRPQINPEGTISLIIDDGIATGMTMAVAVQSLRKQNPAEIWLCVPVAPREMMSTLHSWADQVIVLGTPSPFNSVSRFYEDFGQVEMDTAIACMQSINREVQTLDS